MEEWTFKDIFPLLMVTFGCILGVIVGLFFTADLLVFTVVIVTSVGSVIGYLLPLIFNQGD